MGDVRRETLYAQGKSRGIVEAGLARKVPNLDGGGQLIAMVRYVERTEGVA